MPSGRTPHPMPRPARTARQRRGDGGQHRARTGPVACDVDRGAPRVRHLSVRVRAVTLRDFEVDMRRRHPRSMRREAPSRPSRTNRSRIRAPRLHRWRPRDRLAPPERRCGGVPPLRLRLGRWSQASAQALPWRFDDARFAGPGRRRGVAATWESERRPRGQRWLRREGPSRPRTVCVTGVRSG